MEPDISYNKDNNDEYAAIAGLDHTTQIVKMNEQKPLNDTKCKHEKLIPNPEDTLEDAVYHGCANDKCPVGFYIKTPN